MGAAASGSSILSTDAGSGGHAGFLPFLLGPVSVQSEPCPSVGLLGQQLAHGLALLWPAEGS